MMKLCEVCNSEFLPIRKTQKYCSNKCNQKQWFAKRHKKLKNNGLCVHCGKKPAVRFFLCQACGQQIYQLTKNRNKIRKKIVFEHYGNKCTCCDLDDIDFLTIDHINNDGYKDRRLNYQTVIKRNFPTDLQLLCWNCNLGKAMNGGICPHQLRKSGVIHD